jgi:hypothetical protein
VPNFGAHPAKYHGCYEKLPNKFRKNIDKWGPILVMVAPLTCGIVGYFGAAMAEQFSEIARNAMAGNIQAQRQLANCYLNGCPGLASPDPALACTWDIVIVAGGDPQVSADDVARRRLSCAALDSDQRIRATVEAKAIFFRIHGRELVLPADFFEGPRRAPSDRIPGK